MKTSALNNFSQKKYLTTVIILTASLLSVILILFSTRWGPGISPDSITYLFSAENIAAGKGFSVSFEEGEFTPVTHYPPLFPLALSFFCKLGSNSLHAASILNSSLFFFTVLLCGLLIYKNTSSLFYSVICQILITTFLDFQVIHAMVWSEPLFLFLSLLVIFTFTSYLEKGNMAFLVMASLFSCLAFMTRYAGLGLILACLCSILLIEQSAWKVRIRNFIIFLFLNLIPALIWSLRNASLTGNAFNRKWNFQLLSGFEFKLALNTFSRWILPPGYPSTFSSIIFPILLTALIVLIFILLFKSNSLSQTEGIFPQKILFKFLTVYILSYLYVLVFSFMLLDASIPFGYRMLSPLYIPFFLTLSLSAFFLLKSPLKLASPLKIFFSVALILFCFSYFFTSLKFVSECFENGIAMNSRKWHESKIIVKIKNLPTGIPIYTNGRNILYYHTGRRIKSIPARYDLLTKKENSDFREKVNLMAQDMTYKNGLVLYINDINWQWHLPREQELTKALNLNCIEEDPLGKLYKYSPSVQK